MEKIKIIQSVRNSHGIKVKRFCGSCQYRELDRDGNRICQLMQVIVAQKFRCKEWQMSDGLKNAGLQNGGVVRQKGTTEIIINN